MKKSSILIGLFTAIGLLSAPALGEIRVVKKIVKPNHVAKRDGRVPTNEIYEEDTVGYKYNPAANTGEDLFDPVDKNISFEDIASDKISRSN